MILSFVLIILGLLFMFSKGISLNKNINKNINKLSSKRIELVEYDLYDNYKSGAYIKEITYFIKTTLKEKPSKKLIKKIVKKVDKNIKKRWDGKGDFYDFYHKLKPSDFLKK
jgi:hypothetical protein